MDVLTELGVEVAAADQHHLSLRHRGTEHTFRLVQRSRSPRPSEIHDADLADVLVVAPTLSAKVRSKLKAIGASWVTGSRQVRLRFPDHEVAESVVEPDPPSTAPVLPLRGTGAFAVLRRMLTGEPTSQVALAQATGLTQARVSQVLSALTDAGLTVRTARGWGIADQERALHAWVAQYPGSGGVTTYWRGLEDPWSQTLATLQILSRDAIVSGDPGADILAPWRQPVQAVIYATKLSDLTPIGLVQVGTRAQASLVMCAPDDHTVWPTRALPARFRDRDIQLADPLQVLWDVLAVNDSDSEQAGEQLRQWLKRQVIMSG